MSIKGPTIMVSFGEDLESKYREIFAAASGNLEGVHYFDLESFLSIMDTLDKQFLKSPEFCLWNPAEEKFIRIDYISARKLNLTDYLVKEFV